MKCPWCGDEHDIRYLELGDIPIPILFCPDMMENVMGFEGALTTDFGINGKQVGLNLILLGEKD